MLCAADTAWGMQPRCLPSVGSVGSRACIAALFILLAVTRYCSAAETRSVATNDSVLCALYTIAENGDPHITITDEQGRVRFSADHNEELAFCPSGFRSYFTVARGDTFFRVTATAITEIDATPLAGASWFAERDGSFFCGTEDGIWLWSASGWRDLGSSLFVSDIRSHGNVAPSASERIRMRVDGKTTYANEDFEPFSTMPPFESLTPMIGGLGFGLRDGKVFSVQRDGTEALVSSGEWDGIVSEGYRGEYCVAYNGNSQAIIGASGVELSVGSSREITSVGEGVAAIFDKDSRMFRAFDLDRGLWVTERPYPYLGVFSGGHIGFGDKDGSRGFLSRTGHVSVSLDPRKGFYPGHHDMFYGSVARVSKNDVLPSGKEYVSKRLIDTDGDVLFDPRP